MASSSKTSSSADLRKMTLVLDEYMIETDYEKDEVTNFYLKHAKRIALATQAAAAKGYTQRKGKDQQDEEQEN